MLYVEKDFAQCVKVALDKWDSNKEKLNHQYFYVANCRLSPREFKAAIQKGSNLSLLKANCSHGTKLHVHSVTNYRCSR
jgi:hypothetical protein